MNEIIQSKLALQIAQLSLDKAILQAKVEELQAQLDEATAPKQEEITDA